MPSVLGLLRTGTIEGICSGTSRERVRRILGEPEFTSLPTGKKSEGNIWRWGSVEIGFDDSDWTVRYCCIQLDEPVPDEGLGGPLLTVGDDGVHPGMALPALEALLGAAALEPSLEPGPEPETRWLQVDGGGRALIQVAPRWGEPPAGLVAIYGR